MHTIFSQYECECMASISWCHCTWSCKSSPPQVLQDCMRHHSSLVEVGQIWVSRFFFFLHLKKNHFKRVKLGGSGFPVNPEIISYQTTNKKSLTTWRDIFKLIFSHFCFQGNLHDRYGQLVALYSKLLCTKLEFHVKVKHIVCCYATTRIMSPRWM